MKKYLSVVLVLVLLTAISGNANAAPFQERSGIAHQWMTTEDVTYPAGNYYTEKWLEAFPATMEAWVYIPLAQHSGAVGTILGNYAMQRTDCFTLSVESGGVVQLTIGHSNHYKIYSFSAAPVSPDTWTHIAVVYDAANQQLRLYSDGALKQTVTPEQWYQVPPSALENIFCLAGDYRPINQNGFRGTLGDVTLYADVRTAEEILSDRNAPALQDPDLLLHYDLDKARPESHIPDESGNGYDMHYEKTWLTRDERDALLQQEGKEYAYSIAFLPDVQYTTDKYPHRLEPIFDFLIQNKAQENIQYLITLGDLTDNNTQKEWDAFYAQTQRLEGILPYALVRGNHDVLTGGSAPRYDGLYSAADTSYYRHIQTNGGFYNPENTRNTYLLFTAGPSDYLILNLDFGARDTILKWANNVIAAHPDRRVIVVTHGYMKTNGKLLTGTEYASPKYYFSYFNNGDDLWEKLIKRHANIEMVVCGHYAVDNVIYAPATGDNGNRVHQLLIDPQSADNLLQGLGIVTMLYFTEDGNFARVEHYSTVHDMYFKETTSRLRLDLAPEPVPEEEPAAAPPPEADDNTQLIAIGAGTAAVLAALLTAILFLRKKNRKNK